jgi:chromosome segregation ATPase
VKAKFLNKLLDQTKADARRITDLERQLMIARAEIVTKVDASIAAGRVAHDADWAVAQERHDGLSEVIRRLRGDLDAARASIVDVTNDRDHWQSVARSLSEQLHEANDKIAELEPRIALLAGQRADLEKLCDKVRDRMKRKEIEEEQAILNRRAIVGAVPPPRRLA